MSKKTDLRKAARGRSCTIRIPGVCNFDPATSVLAHYRLADVCGWAVKPIDELGAVACSDCHDLIDGRTRSAQFTREEVRLFHAEGVFRTLVMWKSEGLL